MRCNFKFPVYGNQESFHSACLTFILVTMFPVFRWKKSQHLKIYRNQQFPVISSDLCSISSPSGFVPSFLHASYAQAFPYPIFLAATHTFHHSSTNLRLSIHNPHRAPPTVYILHLPVLMLLPVSVRMN
jgi:hypothetical protein